VLTNLDEDKKKVVEMAVEILERELYYWEAYPISVPPSAARPVINALSADGNRSFYKTKFPTMSERDEKMELAFTSDGSVRRLGKKELEQIWRSGTFDVESVRHPGEKYVWTVSWISVAGREEIAKTFRKRMARIYSLLFILIPRSLIETRPGYLSVPNGIRYIWNGICDVGSNLIGLSARRPKFSSSQIQDKKLRYRSKDIFDVDNIGRLRFKFDTGYITNNVLFGEFVQEGDLQLVVDNSLERVTTWERLQLTFQKIAGEVRAEWLKIEVETQEQISQKLAKEQSNLTAEEASRKIMDGCTEIQIALIKAKVETQLPGKTRELLGRRARAHIIEREVAVEFSRARKEEEERIYSHIDRDHPIRSQLSGWRSDEAASRIEKARKGKEFAEFEEVLARLRKESLAEFAFVVERHIHFLKVVWPPLEKTFRRQTEPRREYTYTINTWNPKNYSKYQ